MKTTAFTGLSKSIWINPDTLEDSNKSKGNYHFDSMLERDTYLILRTYFPDNKIIRQHQVLVLPKSKIYPRPHFWKIDFCVLTKNLEPLFFIESKGQWLLQNAAAKQEFCLKMHALSLTDFDFNKFILVSGQQFKFSIFETITLSQLNQLLSKRT